MSSFVKQSDVRQETFDWGTIGWRLTPDKGSKHLVIMDVTLEPGEGHNFHRHPGQEEMIIVKQGADHAVRRAGLDRARGRRLGLPRRGRDPRVVQRRRRDRAPAGRDRPFARRRDRLRARGRLRRGALGVAAQLDPPRRPRRPLSTDSNAQARALQGRARPAPGAEPDRLGPPKPSAIHVTVSPSAMPSSSRRCFGIQPTTARGSSRRPIAAPPLLPRGARALDTRINGRTGSYRYPAASPSVRGGRAKSTQAAESVSRSSRYRRRHEDSAEPGTGRGSVTAICCRPGDDGLRV